MATDKIDDAIFSIILQIRKNNNRADVNSIHKHIIKIVDFEDVTKEYLDERIHTLITDGKIINKINRNADSYYVNEKDIESILPNDSNTPFISEKSFCTPVISIPDSISETPSIGHNQTPQISKKEIHSNTDELRAEMIALKSFVVDQIYLLKKRSNERETSTSDDTKILISNLTDQIEFLKNELRSKDTIIKLILENCKYNNECIGKSKFNNTNGNNHSEGFQIPKKTSKATPTEKKNLNTFESPNRFKGLEYQSKDSEEDRHDNNQDSNEKSSEDHHDFQRRDNDDQFPNISTKNTPPKRAPTTVILGDSIVKNVYGNNITKSMKHKKHVVVKHFSSAKTDDMYHYTKPTQKKSPAEIIIHVGTNHLPSEEEPEEIANNIINLAKSVKTEENKIAVSSILPRQDKHNKKGKEVNAYLQEKCSQNNFPFITHSNTNERRHTNSKGLHLNNYGDKLLTRNFISFIENG